MPPGGSNIDKPKRPPPQWMVDLTCLSFGGSGIPDASPVGVSTDTSPQNVVRLPRPFRPRLVE